MPESDDRGRVVVALAPAPSAREQWSARIVLDLLDSWSESGHRVVLADCVLEHPMLHRSAGLPNDEGLVDAALFGASVSRVARPVPGRGFFFVGTGSPAGDAEAVIASARLARLRQGFRDAGVTFVAFIRQGCVGEAALMEVADDVLVLALSADQVPPRARDAAGKVRAVVGPAEATSTEAPEGMGEGAGVKFSGVELTAAEAVAADVPEAESAEPSQTWESETGVTPEGPLPSEHPEAGEAALRAVPSDDPVEAAIPDPGEPPTGAPGAGPESWMDFSPQEDGDDQGAGAGEPGTEASPPDTEPVSAPPATAHARRAHRGADPDARKKLLWVALGVLILVVLVVLGALG